MSESMEGGEDKERPADTFSCTIEPGAQSRPSSVSSSFKLDKRRTPSSVKWVDKGTLWDNFEHDQEKTPASGKRGITALLAHLAKETLHDIQATIGAVRKFPQLLIWPTIAFAVITVVGLWSTITLSRKETSQRRSEARGITDVMAQNVDTAVNTILQPIMVMIYAIQANPSWPSVIKAVNRIGPRLVQKPSVKGIITVINVAPNANISLAYPLEGNTAAIGLNLLADPARRGPLYDNMVKRKGTLGGPSWFIQGYWALAGRFPIFIEDLANDTDFDIKYPPVPFNCSQDICGYNNVTKTKFWGAVNAGIRWDRLIDAIERALDGTNAYEYQLVQHNTNGSTSVVAGTAEALRDPVVVHINQHGLNWTLSVSPKSGWHTKWRKPLLIALPIVALLVAHLVFHVVHSRQLFQRLLESMLPKKVIKKLKQDQLYLQKCSNVTILFSDIVSYTSIAAGMEALSVVRMLDEVFSHYDELLEEFGVYKLDIVGDSFIAIAGCPEEEDPVRSATKMALFADAMIRMTDELFAEMGTRIRIRIGLHSGPVVAAVLGLKAPHFSVFGDTVNVASRMESTGLPSKIHASEETMQLLQQSSEQFYFTSRGIIEVKGKGAMQTYFVELVPDEAPSRLLPQLREPTLEEDGSDGGSAHTS